MFAFKAPEVRDAEVFTRLPEVISAPPGELNANSRCVIPGLSGRDCSFRLPDGPSMLTVRFWPRSVTGTAVFGITSLNLSSTSTP